MCQVTTQSRWIHSARYTYTCLRACLLVSRRKLPTDFAGRYICIYIRDVRVRYTRERCENCSENTRSHANAPVPFFCLYRLIKGTDLAICRSRPGNMTRIQSILQVAWIMTLGMSTWAALLDLLPFPAQQWLDFNFAGRETFAVRS